MKVVLPLLGFAVMLSSCATKIRCLNEFDRLPKSKGIFTGSMGMGAWDYGASDAGWHHFYYCWHSRDGMHTRRVKVRRSLVAMPFERPTGGYYKTIAMKPVLHEGTIAGFTRLEGH
jgi:hypothetical protein